MYWNNPLISLHWPSTEDPIAQSFHDGVHCVFFDPLYPYRSLPYDQKLADLCAWANAGLRQDRDEFFRDQRNYYDIANLAKVNMWVHSIRRQGVVKPFLILDDGHHIAGTGESRLRSLERLPHVREGRAFIATHRARRHLYQNLEPVTSFDQFAELCCACPGQHFLFRLTDVQAPYGIYWYEFDSAHTRTVTPDDQTCVDMIKEFCSDRPDFEFAPEWFDWDVWPNAQS